MSKRTIEDEYFCHAFEDKTDRFPEDMLLREYGFIIKYRKKKKMAIWSDPQGQLINHVEAVKEVRAGRWCRKE